MGYELSRPFGGMVLRPFRANGFRPFRASGLRPFRARGLCPFGARLQIFILFIICKRFGLALKGRNTLIKWDNHS